MSNVILSSVEKKLRFLMKTVQIFSPYNGPQREPNGLRSKRQFQCKLQTGLIKPNHRSF